MNINAKLKDKKNLLSLITLITLFFSACDGDNPVEVRNKAIKNLYDQGKIRIAVANNMTTRKSDQWNGLLLAKKKLEENGSFDKEIELVRYDDKGTVVDGTQVAYEISRDKSISIVIGHGYSDISLSTSLIYQYYGILMFNVGSTLPKLTERNNPILFRNIPNDNVFGARIAHICEEYNFNRVLVYYLNMASATSLANRFELNVADKNRNITIVSRESYDSSTSEADINRQIKRWKKNYVFDAIFLAGVNPQVGKIVRLIRNNDLTCPILGADYFDVDAFTSTLTEKDDGKIFTVSNFDDSSTYPPFLEFHNSFVGEYNEEPDLEALQAYDALIVIAKAISQAGSAEPDKIAEVLKREVWKEAAGPYMFNDHGDVSNRHLVTKIFKDGGFVIVDR